jgi:hypothetical protein
MQEPKVDDRHFPLVVNIIPERIHAEHLPAFFARSEAVLRLGRPYVTITDTTACQELPNAVVRKALADWSKQFEPLMKRYTVGSAIVITSPLIRGGLTALFWLAPPPYPLQIVATLTAAVDAVSEHYAAAGHAVPEGFRTYAAELRVKARSTR